MRWKNAQSIIPGKFQLDFKNTINKTKLQNFDMISTKNVLFIKLSRLRLKKLHSWYYVNSALNIKYTLFWFNKCNKYVFTIITPHPVCNTLLYCNVIEDNKLEFLHTIVIFFGPMWFWNRNYSILSRKRLFLKLSRLLTHCLVNWNTLKGNQAPIQKFERPNWTRLKVNSVLGHEPKNYSNLWSFSDLSNFADLKFEVQWRILSSIKKK